MTHSHTHTDNLDPCRSTPLITKTVFRWDKSHDITRTHLFSTSLSVLWLPLSPLWLRPLSFLRSCFSYWITSDPFLPKHRADMWPCFQRHTHQDIHTDTHSRRAYNGFINQVLPLDWNLRNVQPVSAVKGKAEQEKVIWEREQKLKERES